MRWKIPKPLYFLYVLSYVCVAFVQEIVDAVLDIDPCTPGSRTQGWREEPFPLDTLIRKVAIYPPPGRVCEHVPLPVRGIFRGDNRRVADDSVQRWCNHDRIVRVGFPVAQECGEIRFVPVHGGYSSTS